LTGALGFSRAVPSPGKLRPIPHFDLLGVPKSLEIRPPQLAESSASRTLPPRRSKSPNFGTAWKPHRANASPPHSGWIPASVFCTLKVAPVRAWPAISWNRFGHRSTSVSSIHDTGQTLTRLVGVSADNEVSPNEPIRYFLESSSGATDGYSTGRPTELWQIHPKVVKVGKHE